MGVYIPLPRQYIGMFLISLFAGNGKHIGTGLHLIPMCKTITHRVEIWV